jgi:hypothetical protein
MQRFFKYIKIILLSALGLLAFGVFLAIFGQDIASGWRMAMYTHPNEVAEISVGDEAKELFFRHGKGQQEEDYIIYKELDATFDINSLGKITYIFFVPDKMNTKYTHNTFPIQTVEDLQDKFGAPNIYSSSKDQLSRRYTYSTDNLLTGVTYSFEQNRITSIGIGNITWRQSGSEQGDYMVNGTIFCPGERCPFVGDDVKPEWQGKSVRDLVANK